MERAKRSHGRMGSELHKILFLNGLLLVSLGKTYFFVKRDHGPGAEGAASSHNIRGTIVVRAAQSHAPREKCTLVKIDERAETLFESPVVPERRLGP